MDYQSLLIHFIKTVFAAVAGSVTIYLLLKHFNNYGSYAGVLNTIFSLAVSFVIGGGIFILICYVFGLFKATR